MSAHSQSAPRSHHLFIDGPAGKLEAILNPIDRPRFLAVVCHPHPLYQGTMHNKVAVSMARAFASKQAAVLRFNYRGVMESEGQYDNGVGELYDAEAAAEYLLFTYRKFDVPLVMSGFSFGSWITLRLALTSTQITHVVGLGMPLRLFNEPNIDTLSQPKLLISGTHDDFAPLPELTEFLEKIAPPKRIHLIEGADHFFTGMLHRVRHEIEQWVDEAL